MTELSWHIVISGILVTAAAALLGWILARSIAHPLGQLTLAAEALGRDAPLHDMPRPSIRESRAIAEALSGAAAELQWRERTRRLLVDELNHRVKNTLATVQSLATQSFRGLGEEGEVGRARFEPRLFALSAAHNVLTQEHRSGADLHTIVAEIVQPFDDAVRSCFVLEGRPVRLSSEFALAISMNLHELCANAAKFGALSTPDGRVRVTWRLLPSDGRRLRLVWSESGGPEVRPPSRRGFGSRLIERGLSAELGGTAGIRFEPTSIVCELDALLERA